MISSGLFHFARFYTRRILRIEIRRDKKDEGQLFVKSVIFFSPVSEFREGNIVYEMIA